MSQEIDLQPRIVGMEMEYNYRFTNGKGIPDVLHEPEKRALQRGVPDSVIGYNRSMVGYSLNYFLENGARYYTDIHGLLEYATPECASFHEAVIHDMAGEEYLTAHLSSEPVAEAMDKVRVYKRVSDHGTERTTAGAHENYASNSLMVNTDFTFHSTAMNGLASHLITRSIFTGAGSIDHEGSFHKTQKLRNMDQVVGNTTQSGLKPIVNTRPESLGAIGSRIHVITGDPNISPWAALSGSPYNQHTV